MEERLCFHKHDFGISVEWISVPCDCIVGAIKTAFSKRSLQMYLNNQILDYNAILHLCENEMMLISFLEFVRRSWSLLKILRFKNDMSVGRLYLSHGIVTI